ncbi:MAG: hypothetical protein MK135_03410 [Polyangiaceae bacterium]|nr:hypothetical protein [Polyangiaceae bacterium]
METHLFSRENRRNFPFSYWYGLLIVFVLGCSENENILTFPEAPLSTTLKSYPTLSDPNCRKNLINSGLSREDADSRCENFAESGQTWHRYLSASSPNKRFVFLGDTGTRSATGQPTADALKVGEKVRQQCQGACQAIFFLGDNIYEQGLKDKTDLQYLKRYTHHWLSPSQQIGKELFFIQGNHDWGSIFPSRARAQALHRAIQLELPAQVRGSAHFWEYKNEDLRVIAFDSNYLVRQCSLIRGQLSCPTSKLNPASGAAINLENLRRLYTHSCPEKNCRSATISVGHHPYKSNGLHGSAGNYHDWHGFSLGRGEAWKKVFDEIITQHSSLYFSGHEHGVHVHHQKQRAEFLSVIVGSGAKASPSGPKTSKGSLRHERGMVLEAFCRLGFAIVDQTDRGLRVQVFSFFSSDSSSCLKKMQSSRRAKNHDLGELVGRDDLRCRSWTFDSHTWKESPCAKGKDDPKGIGN